MYHVSTNTRLPTIQVLCVSTNKQTPRLHTKSLQTQEMTHHTSVMCLHTRLPTIQASCVYTQDYPPYKRHVYTQDYPPIQVSCVYTQETTHHTSVMPLLQGDGVGGGHLQQVNSLLDSVQLPLHVAQFWLKLRRPLELAKLHHHLCKVFLPNKGTRKVSTVNADLKEKSGDSHLTARRKSGNRQC